MDSTEFVLLYGPQAVGKTIVGQELARITGLKLLHNHMTIALLELFSGLARKCGDYRPYSVRRYFFTFVWAFNKKRELGCSGKSCHYLRTEGAEIYFVELEAHDVEERPKPNQTPNRLEQKSTKRNIKQSEENLLNSMDTLRLNSKTGEIKEEHDLRIDNTELSAVEVAQMIKHRFRL